jgi:hypothetical protein
MRNKAQEQTRAVSLQKEFQDALLVRVGQLSVQQLQNATLWRSLQKCPENIDTIGYRTSFRLK